MLNDYSRNHDLDAERYRRIARELRYIAFNRAPFDLCRKNQLLALAKGFDRFADRVEGVDERAAAD